MKSIFKIFLLACCTSLLLTACDKTQDLQVFSNGAAPVLTASATTVAPPAADSNKVALTLTWTDPTYATDSANQKFTIEIDSAGKNFSKAASKVVNGTKSAVFTAKELNSILLGYGYAFGVPVDMDVRVISSYANNNERLLSNTVRIKMTPYKIPPKVALPTSSRLFIVGDATTFGWTNDPAPAFPAAREFARLDETTWAGIFYMNGSGGYKLLQTQGVWGTQFHMVSGGTATAGSFVQEDADPGFSSPATAGWYKLTFDFQSGKYTVTPYTGTLAASLFIVGNATPGGDASGWNNPVPVPSQQFTRVNSSLFELTIALNAGKSYVLLPVNGSWADKYGGMAGNNSNNVNADEFKFGGSDMLSPAVSGNYKISVNFAAGTAPGSSGRFTLTKL